MPVGATAAASAAASLGGAAIQSSSANSASKSAQNAANQQLDFQKGVYSQAQSNLNPYAQQGQLANSALGGLLGLNGDSSSDAAFKKYLGSTNYNFQEIVGGQYQLVNQTVGGAQFSKQDIMCNLKTTCENILEKLLTIQAKDTFTVTSSYRQNGILKKESSNSDHNKGMAVDIQLNGSSRNDFQAHYDLIIKLSQLLNYKQLLLEYRDTSAGRIVWIHASYDANGNKKQNLTLVNDRTYDSKFVLLAG